MANFLIIAVFSCFVCALATNYPPAPPPKGTAYGPRYGPPKGSPLAEDEPIILHTNRPLLITKTIQQLPQEALKALSHVDRAHSKLLRVHELRDEEYGQARILDAPAPIYDAPIAAPIAAPLRLGPSKSLLTQPIILDNGHRSLHDLRLDALHESKLYDVHQPILAPVALPYAKSAAYLPRLHAAAPPLPLLPYSLPSGAYGAPLLLQEKRLARPILVPAAYQVPAPLSAPVKYLKPAY